MGVPNSVRVKFAVTYLSVLYGILHLSECDTLAYRTASEHAATSVRYSPSESTSFLAASSDVISATQTTATASLSFQETKAYVSSSTHAVPTFADLADRSLAAVDVRSSLRSTVTAEDVGVSQTSATAAHLSSSVSSIDSSAVAVDDSVSPAVKVSGGASDEPQGSTAYSPDAPSILTTGTTFYGSGFATTVSLFSSAAGPGESTVSPLVGRSSETSATLLPGQLLSLPPSFPSAETETPSVSSELDKQVSTPQPLDINYSPETTTVSRHSSHVYVVQSSLPTDTYHVTDDLVHMVSPSAASATALPSESQSFTATPPLQVITGQSSVNTRNPSLSPIHSGVISTFASDAEITPTPTTLLSSFTLPADTTSTWSSNYLPTTPVSAVNPDIHSSSSIHTSVATDSGIMGPLQPSVSNVRPTATQSVIPSASLAGQISSAIVSSSVVEDSTLPSSSTDTETSSSAVSIGKLASSVTAYGGSVSSSVQPPATIRPTVSSSGSLQATASLSGTLQPTATIQPTPSSSPTASSSGTLRPPATIQPTTSIQPTASISGGLVSASTESTNHTSLVTIPVPIVTLAQQTVTPKYHDINAIDKTDKVPHLTVSTTTAAATTPKRPPLTPTTKPSQPITPPSNELEPDRKPEFDGKTPPTVYVSVQLKSTWAEFCRHLPEFQAVVVRLLADHRKWVIAARQVQIVDTGKCVARGSTEILIDFFITDAKGRFDPELTGMLADILDDEQLFFNAVENTPFAEKVISVKIYGGSPQTEESVDAESTDRAIGVGITVGIIVATLVGLVVIGFIIFQILVIRKRRGVKMMRYIHDSRYSIDVHSIHEAIQLTGVSSPGNRFAYVNPGLEADDRDHTSNPLTYEGLTDILRDLDTLEDEYLLLHNTIPKLSNIPLGAEHKNRFANVIPIPETRVVLKRDPSDDAADYINANFVRGHLLCPESYIATQAPMEGTRGDFWQMVWDQHSQVIIMLTGLEERGLPKCVEYWPNTVGGDVVRVYGDFKIVKKKREVKPEWILSILKLKNLKTMQDRDVVHFWLTAWPIDGVPDSRTVINFLLEARPYMEYGGGPTVVHCSPGNGRTGTLLAIDIQMQSYDDTKMVDILNCLHKLREDRAGAVQNKDQYIFIYKVLFDYIRMLNSRHNSNASSITSINFS